MKVWNISEVDVIIRNIFLYLFIVVPFSQVNSVRDKKDLLELEKYAKVGCNENDKKWIEEL